MTGEEGERKGDKTETGFNEDEEGRSETDGVVAAVAGGRRLRREKNEDEEEGWRGKAPIWRGRE